MGHIGHAVGAACHPKQSDRRCKEVKKATMVLCNEMMVCGLCGWLHPASMLPNMNLCDAHGELQLLTGGARERRRGQAWYTTCSGCCGRLAMTAVQCRGCC